MGSVVSKHGSPVVLSRKPDDARTVEERIGATAAVQHGVLTLPQLLEAGLSVHQVERRARSGRLVRLHRGVYLHGALTGPLEPPLARPMAAVLACGPGAVVSYESAATLWKLVPAAEAGPVHVTVPGGDRGRRPGLAPHRVASLPGEDRGEVDRVPVTAPPRTLVDLAAHVRPRTLEQALAEAERTGLAKPEEVARVLERRPRARGRATLRQWVSVGREPAYTRSEAEERFLELSAKGDLPEPRTNVRIGGVEVDCLWRAERVVVEVDGFAYHAPRRRFEGDRRRDARLAALGFHVVRVTWRQLVDEPEAVLVRLAQILALARSGSR